MILCREKSDNSSQTLKKRVLPIVAAKAATAIMNIPKASA